MEQPDGIVLQQYNMQQVINRFQVNPQLNILVENHQDVIRQLVQEAMRSRQEMRETREAMRRALELVDQNQQHHSQYTQRVWERVWERVSQHEVRIESLAARIKKSMLAMLISITPFSHWKEILDYSVIGLTRSSSLSRII